MDTMVALLIVCSFHLSVATCYVAIAQTRGCPPPLSCQEVGALVQAGVPDVRRSRGSTVCISCHSSRTLTAAIREMIGSWC